MIFNWLLCVNKMHFNILLSLLVVYELKKTVLLYPLPISHMIQCRHKFPNSVFAIGYFQLHLPYALSVFQSTFWNEVQHNRNYMSCNLKIFSSE